MDRLVAKDGVIMALQKIKKYKTLTLCGALRQFKYYLLSAAATSISAANIVYVYYIFGKTESTAAYFLAANAVSVFNLLTISPIEQFIYYYISRGGSDSNCRREFLGTVLVLLLFFAGAIAIIVSICAIDILRMISGAVSEGVENKMAKLTMILSVNILLAPFSQIFQQVLNSDLKIGCSYLLALLSPLLQFLTLSAGFFSRVSIEALAISIIVGQTIGLAIGLYQIRGKIGGFNINILPTVKNMVLESARVRAAHNIHNISQLVLLGRYVSEFSPEIISQFMMAKRASDAFVSVANGPSTRLLPGRFAENLSCGRTESIVQDLERAESEIEKMYILVGSIGFAIFVIVSFVGMFSVNFDKFFTLAVVFLFFNALTISKELPYSCLIMAFGVSKTFFLSNTCYAVALYFCLQVGSFFNNPVSIPIAVMISQVIVFYNNRRSARNMLLNVGGSMKTD